MRILLFTTLFVASQLNAALAMSTDKDGALVVESNTALMGDDSRFDFSRLVINEGVILSAEPSQFPSGITLYSSGDVLINGLLDFSGIDLTINTSGGFSVGPRGSFLANDFTINANTISLPENFQPVAGGYFNIPNPVEIPGSFSGYGGEIQTTFSGAGTLDYNFSGSGVVLSLDFLGSLPEEGVFFPLQENSVGLVPVPPALAMVLIPFLILGRFRKRSETPIS